MTLHYWLHGLLTTTLAGMGGAVSASKITGGVLVGGALYMLAWVAMP